jgi:hypothetical protein
MRMYQARTDDDSITGIIAMIETDTRKDIFTLRMIGDKEDGEMGILIVFKDETILMGEVEFGSVHGKKAIRLKGHFI